jgi:hypothetical protein
MTKEKKDFDAEDPEGWQRTRRRSAARSAMTFQPKEFLDADAPERFCVSSASSATKRWFFQ